MRKKYIAITTLFTIITTYLAVYFQWAEFYEGYSYSAGNFLVSFIFLFAWLTFSFYCGKIKRKEYRKFIVVYWSVNIISAIVIWIFANNKLTNLFASPFYVWNGGPLYGFRDVFFTSNRLIIDIPSLILITSPLGILSCFIGYWYGGRISKLKKS